MLVIFNAHVVMTYNTFKGGRMDTLLDDLECDELSTEFFPEPPKVALFSTEDLNTFHASIGSSDNRRSTFNRLKAARRGRYLLPPPANNEVKKIFGKLLSEMPNFTEVIEHLKRQAVLRNRSDVPIMGTQPLLLLGDPGIGKTYFAEKLAAALSLELNQIDCASISASFELVGGSSLWSESTFGRIFSFLLNGISLNQIVLLDEVEKAAKGQYPVHGALFRLLNPTQSRKFIDEAVSPLAIDASRLIYILTANSLDEVHPAIVDRCLVFTIEQPTKTQSINVAKSVWASLRSSETWAQTFEETLSNEVLKALSAQTPRSMKQSLENAMATAALRGKNSKLIASDIVNHKQQQETRRIGF